MIAALGVGLRSLCSVRGCAVGLFAAVFAALVTILLGLASVLPAALSAGSDRQNNRYPVEDPAQAVRPVVGQELAGSQRDTVWHGLHISIVDVVEAGGATPPPGVAELPVPGHSVVSPALMDLLRQDDSGLLANRIPEPVGAIGPTGLESPDELFAYVGVASSDVSDESSIAPIRGWGFSEGTLFRSEVSPYLALPLLALVIAPTLALLTALLQLDQRRRDARLAGLHLLGASRRQRLATDAGALMAPLLAGWFAALPLADPFNTALADHALGGRLFFDTDLSADLTAQLGALILLLVVAGSLSSSSIDAGAAIERIEGHRRYRIGARAIVATSLLGIGAISVTLVLLSGDTSELRSSVWIVGSAIALVVGATTAIPVLVHFLCHWFTGNRLVGELVSARLSTTRSSWRSAALSLLLAGTTTGTSLGVLTALDAASEADQVIWNPSLVSPNTTYASLPKQELLRLLQNRSFGEPVAVINAGRATLRLGDETTPVPAMLVPCSRLADVIDPGNVPVTSTCGTAWVINDNLNPHGSTATVNVPESSPVTISVRTGSVRAPAQIIGGTDSIIIPHPDNEIPRILGKAADSNVFAVFDLKTPDRVEKLRDHLWQQPTLPFNGSTGALSSVVSKTDLVADGRHYTDDYARFLLTMLFLASACALITAALASSMDSAEQAQRNATLTVIGAPTRLAKRAARLATYLPAVVAMACGTTLGLAMGVAYLMLTDYPQLAGPLRGFPLQTLAAFTATELLTFAALAHPLYLLTVRRLRTVDAGTLGNG